MKKIILITTLCCLFFSTAFAQITVSGVITDDSGIALPGANVKIKGSSTGTVSDLDGKFSIQVPGPETILEISFIGYTSFEITAADAIQMFSKPEKKEKPIIEKEEKTQTDPKEDLNIYLSKLSNNKSHSPFIYAYSRNQNDTINLPIKATNVEVNIAGIIADVSVKQIYINNSPNVIEAVYVFPGSSQSAVYAMNMKIGSRVLEAKIKEKEEARAIYDQAKLEGKTASLLVQHRPNVFQMDVANILPGDTIIVEFRYTETVTAIDGEYKFLFPRIVGPRYTTTNETWAGQHFAEENANVGFNIKINIQSPIPIKEIIADSLKVNINKEDKRRAEITLDDSEKKLNKEDIVIKYRLRGDNVESGIMTYEHGDENFFLLMMEPPKKVKKEQIPPREYIIIMDVSGSMSGYPIETSKTLLKKLAESFDSTDVFNIVQFAAGNDAFAPKSVPATKTNLKLAYKFIDQPSGNGGTELLSGLKTAFNLRVDSGYSTTFIIATDGFVTVEQQAFNFIRKNLNSANVFCFGIGTSVNHFFIEGVAYAGMGEAYVVSDENEADKVTDGLIEKIKYPVLTNIKAEFEGAEIYDIEPSAIHDVFSNRPVILYGKYKGKVDGKIIISGKSGKKKFQEEFKLQNGEENKALRYLWARNRIKYLSDYAFYFEDPYPSANNITPERKQKIIDLGLKYNLLTNYTSFVAVDTMVRTMPESGADANFYQNNYTQIPTSNSHTPIMVRGNSISLSTDACLTEEVVVVGYGTQKRTDVTGNISTISTENLIQINMIPDILLQNKVSGLNILRGDNAFSGISNITICGQNSILRNSFPRFTLNNSEIQQSVFSNNFLINSNFTQDLLPVNPDFIDNIVISKSGYSQYSLENSDNGIFTITLKKPREGRRTIQFNSSYSFDKVGNLPKGINNEQKALFENGFTLRNSICASRAHSRWGLSLMGSNTKQTFLVPGTESTTNNIGLNGKFELISDLTINTDVLWLNQNRSGMPRYSANSGLLYMMMNSDIEKTKLLINSSKSNFKQNLFIPSINFDYKIGGLNFLHFKYNISSNISNSELSNEFKSDFSMYGTGSALSIKNQMTSISHRPEVLFYKSFEDHNLRANISATFDNLDEKQILINSTNIQPDTTYQENYKKNKLTAIFSYNYNNLLLFNSAYTLAKNNLYSGNLKTTNQFSIAGGLVYSNLKCLYDQYWMSNGKLVFGYDKIESTPPVFLPPAMIFGENLTQNNPLYTTNAYKTKYAHDLKPENTQRFSISNNLGLLNNKIMLNLEIYEKRTKNLFVPVDLNNSLIENNGEIVSKGINADISFMTNSSDWTFEPRLIFTVNRSVVKNLSNNQAITLAGIDNVRSYAMNGKPFGYIISENGEIGNPNPDWTLSYNSSLNWKMIGLDIVTEWKEGGDIWNASSNTIEDASWFKLSQINLKYTLRSNICRRLRLEALSIYLFTNNLLTLTKYSGVSPDNQFFININSTGIDYYNMPDMKSFGVGLRIKI
jgi:Ca-activated chloride channel family protein